MGCPLAAAAFTLALHAALAHTHDDLHQIARTATIPAYMDDINIMCAHADIPKAYAAIKHNLTKLGLQLNESKTECWIHPDALFYAAHYNHIPRATRPMVLKTAAEPLPTFPENNDRSASHTHHTAPEMQNVLEKCTANATRLQSLQSSGLCNHVAQALWRSATASAVTSRARCTGIDENTASQLTT